ncbi:hypothetical protein DPEC_G00157780 [Dallia pectoralis]|uniref:Uncharacterized protein n=1 Tax=Dallia pectoralis TaxID=75939 RepID=A0ACC2GL06_DALPE|nr:hypothetical protein DPEC_G00157780 [Dallia pectoralis]
MSKDGGNDGDINRMDESDDSEADGGEEILHERIKRHGPKRKQVPKARKQRFKVRRTKANAQDRNRMHGLNDVLETSRKLVTCYSNTEKLSKIETLRLATNYICALSEILQWDESPDVMLFVQTLCQGLSQPSTNLVAGCLQLNQRTFLPADIPPQGHQTSSASSSVQPSYPYPSPPYGSMDSHIQASSDRQWT